MLDTSTFAHSSLAVRDNAVKNVIFKAAAILLQFFLTQVFAFIAFKWNDYTAFLMFSETLAQKAFFAISRSFNSRALLVLTFAVLAVAFGFYDTLLWALDSPGYITQRTTKPASSLASNLLQNPQYIISINNPSRHLEDMNVDEAITSNIFKPGFNFSLQAIENIGPRDTVLSPGNITETGARIWLDNEGFSVGLDQGFAVTIKYACPMIPLPDSLTSQAWKCTVNNTDALDTLLNRVGDVQVWWYGVNNTELIQVERKDNPWQSLGAGGGTAVMKQIFTITKGRRRHTFLETVLKITMITTSPPFEDSDVTDLIRRTWSPDPSQPIDNNTQAFVDMALQYEHSNKSLTFGVNLEEQNSVASSSIELLNVLNSASGDFDYTVLRIGSVNITLLRSEDIEDAPQPFIDCSVASTNIATGGQVQSSNCYKSFDPLQNKTFMGQVDTSSVLIFTNVIGDGTSSKSVASFNQTGYDWFKTREGRIDDLLTARGVLLGGNKDIVHVTVLQNVAAVSYLQIFLTVLPLALALFAWILTLLSPMSYYQHSLLAAVATTTHLTPSSERSGTCKKVSTLRNPPELTLVRLSDEHTVIQTADGGMVAHMGEQFLRQRALHPMDSPIAVHTPTKQEMQILMDPPFLQAI
ncbi:hypothetical protein CPB83DRAFT_858685 [Crepidotus variabilis]|uniref:Uncharacterized protein n=1 Tax=Crepidotus variabilis TaxID=179855 RepID=A0A9P6EAT6_9AGAR|nr:hypothetical protein CPB83DRAFT_858685 [Crepidotus variabilis]